MVRGKPHYNLSQQMEQTHLNHTQNHPSINSLTPNNIFLVLAFLDPLSIHNLIQADHQQNTRKLKLAAVARNRLFLKNYLNKTDRTIYMPFYSDTLFMQLQEQQLSHLCSRSAPVLSYLSESFKLLFSRLQAETSDFEMSSELIQSITESLTDPELPFPKLRKGSIGMHCNSAFQFFLVDKLSPASQEEDLEYTFEELSKYLSQRWNFGEQNQQRQSEIMSEVFKSWFKISYENFQNYLIPNKINHNLVVLLVALLDLLIDSISFYVEAIQDPLYAFIEFNMRYCIFRNIILSLQNKLGFVFKNYSSFVSGLLQAHSTKMRDQGSSQAQAREMTIWHCGLSKWYIYMQRYHEANFKNFFYLLRKLNVQNIIQENNDKINQNITFLQLRNRLMSNEADLLERQLCYEVYSPIEQLLEEKRELYNQVIKEYMEYIMDISINQFSVHWCGHSQQALHIPYQQFEDSLLPHFQEYFFKMIEITKQVHEPIKALDSTTKSIIKQLDKQYLKPVTLKKILQLVKVQINKEVGEEAYLKSELFEYISELNHQSDDRDRVLAHFNQLANVKNEVDHKYSIVLQSQDFNMILKNSASTAVSRSSRFQNLPPLLNLNSIDSIMSDF